MPSPDKYAVIISSKAERDLERIFMFIARTQEDAIIARNFLEHLKARIFSLDTFPKASSKFSDVPNVYVANLKKYKIIYAVHEPTKRVLVLRIVHSAREKFELE